eukprot:6485813-Amphidinium_carterae.1
MILLRGPAVAETCLTDSNVVLQHLQVMLQCEHSACVNVATQPSNVRAITLYMDVMRGMLPQHPSLPYEAHCFAVNCQHGLWTTMEGSKRLTEMTRMQTKTCSKQPYLQTIHRTGSFSCRLVGMFGLVRCSSCKGQTTAVVGRQHQPEFFERMVPDADRRSCISRAHFEVMSSWSHGDLKFCPPKKSALAESK